MPKQVKQRSRAADKESSKASRSASASSGGGGERKRAAAAAVGNDTAGDANTDSKPPATKRKYTKKAVIDTRQYDYLNDNDSLAKIRSAKVCANRWSSILMARDNRKKATVNDANKMCVDEMFDCSDLIIPPTTELLELEAENAIEKWKALDSRVINTDYEGEDDGGLVGKTDAASEDGSHRAARGHPMKERVLPPNFDYQCRNNPPNEDDDQEKDRSKRRRKRVISLLDPTQTLDYESELWKVFKSMPTVKEVERQYALGASTDDAGGDDDISSPPVNHGCQHTLSITNTLEKLRRKYTRIDAHALGRLRVRERHPSLYQYSGEDTVLDNSSLLQTTLRFEILQPNVEDLRRGSGPDGNRLEVELHGSQHTLLDLHHTLVEHASICSGSDSGHQSAGIFLIEDVMYTHGDVGKAAADAIVKELEEEREEESTPSDNVGKKTQVTPKMVTMDTIKLEDLNLRLGVRYTHINLPSPETGTNISWDRSSASSLFVTGIQSHPLACSSPENEDQRVRHALSNRAPVIIHDIWTSSQQSLTHNLCAACNYLPASVKTVNDMMTDASLTINNAMGTPLCASCFRELHYQKSDSGGDMLQLRPNRSELKVFPAN